MARVVPSMYAAVAVHPMPGRPTPFMAALAASMDAASCAASADLGPVLAMVSTAIALATSPAAWPPMPSHTQKSGEAAR